MWLDFNLDWDKVSQTKNLARKEWVAVQAKVLKSQMDEDKFNDLIRKRTEAGLYYTDDDWPSDPMEKGSEKCEISSLMFFIIFWSVVSPTIDSNRWKIFIAMFNTSK